MSFGDPRKRKPIRSEESYDEIKDNVKNQAVLTRSRSKTNYSMSNSGHEEVLSAEIDREFHKTFIINHSPQHFARRNSGSNQMSYRKSTSQSPEVRNNEMYDSSTNDISDDEEYSEELNTSRNSETKFLQNRKPKPTPCFRPESAKVSNKLRSSSSRKSHESTANFQIPYLLGIVIIVIIIMAYFVTSRTNSVDIGTQTEASDVYSESQVLDDVLITFRNMKSKYKNQNRNLWLDAYSSIATLINQETKRPSIIVLLGNKSNPLECLARLIGNVSSKALRSDRLVLTPKEFEADMGTVLQTMRSHLKDNKAIIVSDLLNINVEALKAFHNLCDRINPLVDEAIYIITVIADDYDDNSNPLEYIETQLYKKLSGKMEKDAIEPLITRLTDGPILTVKPEPTVTDCSL